MKIVLTGSLHQGGAERTISSLSNALSRKGHELIIYHLDRKDSPFYSLDESVVLKYINFRRLKPLTVLYLISAIRRELKEDNPQWLIAFDSRTLIYGLFAKGNNIKLLYSERSNPTRYPDSSLWRKLRDWAIKKTDLNVFQTEGVKALFPLRAQRKSVVIPNAVFNENVIHLPYPEKRENFIASMGRLDCSIKGFDTLIKSFAQISSSFPEIELRIYGHGKDKQKLLGMAEEYHISNRFKIIEGNENAILEIRTARIFVMPSRYEGFPNALLEALSCGVPCISTDCDYGPRDMIVHGENGLLVPVDDVDALAHAILKLLSDYPMADSLAKMAFMQKWDYQLENISNRWFSALQGEGE